MQMGIQDEENENEKNKEENQVTDQENEGKIVIYYDENEAEIEIIDPADNQEANQADNQERNGIDHVENKNNQGVTEAREVTEVDKEENKVETYEALPALFQVNEPELSENRYRYVGIHDWPLVWIYDVEQMIRESEALGSTFFNPNVEINKI